MTSKPIPGTPLWELYIDKLTKQAMDYALHQPPPAGAKGDLLYGHDIDKLLNALPQVEKAHVMMNIKKQVGALAAPSYLQAVGKQQDTAPKFATLEQKLAARMNWPINGEEQLDFNYFDIHRIGDTVFLWVITKDAQATTLTDDVGLFPSDALVTKLNLLK